MTYRTDHLISGANWSKKFTANGSDGISRYIPSNGWEAPFAKSLSVQGIVASETTNAPEAQWRLVPEVKIKHTGIYQFSRPAWVEVTPESLGIECRFGCVLDATGVLIDLTLDSEYMFVIPGWDRLGYPGVRFRVETPSASGTPSIRAGMTITEKG